MDGILRAEPQSENWIEEQLTARDTERIDRLVDGLREHALDAVIATLPANVLLLTGYLPVIGTSIAIATVDRQVLLLAPNDERELAEAGHADQVIYFAPTSLDQLTTATEAVSRPLREVIRAQSLDRAAIGCESAECHQPASYASMHLYQDSLAAFCRLRPAGAFFRSVKSTLTGLELERLRRSCRRATAAFEEGERQLTIGMLEKAAAATFRELFAASPPAQLDVHRSDSHFYCMAGPHSAEAYGAYARSRPSPIHRRDLVLVHCNSHADGYWTDITRTYCMGDPDDLQQRVYRSVGEAREAALDCIRPGARASDIDRAARMVMSRHGFGDQFKHSTGHGVGFAAIDPTALPRLHPASEDRLETGMVFNVEPAAYIEGFGGIRHCDMVAVTAQGFELLTPTRPIFEDGISL